MGKKSAFWAAATALMLVVAPLAAQVKLTGPGGSTRLTLRCNVDGSYVCANEPCNGNYCCEIAS